MTTEKQTPINNAVLQGVIGFGSLEGWTRHQCYEEFSKIKEAAKAGGLRLTEWDNMDATLSLLIAATTCDKFATLVRLYFKGDTYLDQKFNDSENWFLS